jgi:hypothetical protein
MRFASSIMCVCTILLWGYATAPPTPLAQSPTPNKPTPLILEKNEGEQRVVRGWPGHPDPGENFILQVDPKNGGSSHLVLIYGRPRARKGNRCSQAPQCGRNPILADRNRSGALGRLRERDARWRHRVHPCPYVDFCLQHWKRRHQPGVRLFRAGLRGPHAGRFAKERKTSRYRKPRTMRSRESTHTL